MGARLELKFGLVADADRIATSADTLLVEEPTIGSQARTKGNLYVVVSSAKLGGRAHEATALVAATIRREYYYDESAGVPICLEKAVRSANRRLRSSREGAGLPPGALGVALAVVRQGELYVATVGDAEAYLVRAARLLMPDQTATPGVPADDALRVDVWRGELAVGDSVLLVSRNLTEVVGTEELKNAVVTLHPQSAVEHLHHLFVAAGGDGSDAVLAMEATELAPSRSDRRPFVDPGQPDPYGDLAGGPIPGADQVVGAAGAITGAFGTATGAITGAFSGGIDRLLGLMPRRGPSTRGLASSASRRESQRRAAIALLALLGVVLVLGVGMTVFPRGAEDPVVQLSGGERAFRDAQSKADRGAKLISGDPETARGLFQEAWADLLRAREGGVPPESTGPLETAIVGGLDGLYDTGHPRTQRVYDASEMQPKAMVQGPDKAAYFIDADSRAVWRVDRRTGAAKEVVIAGDGPGDGIGRPRLLATGGPDLIIVDDKGLVWRYRPSGVPIRQLRLTNDVVWGDDIIDVETLLTNEDEGIYNLYAIDPSANQIHRYLPTLDGGGFATRNDYLATDNEDVSAFRDMVVDASLYALTKDGLVRHYSGRLQDFRLATPPDDGDIRPGHDYRYVAALGDKLYVYDAKWSRVIVFDKVTGSYLAQWLTSGKVPLMDDLRGMYVVQPQGEKGRAAPAPVLVWLSPNGLYQSTLVDDPDAAVVAVPTPGPDASIAPEGTTKPPKKTPKP